MTDSIVFTAVAGTEYREELEDLLFFNPQQRKALNRINHSIRYYGPPGIVEELGRLRVKVPGLHDTQTLFALHNTGDRSRIAGVAVYSRTDAEKIVLLHIAVKQEFSRSGVHADLMLVPQFMAQIRAVGRRLKGVRSISLAYAAGLTLPV